MHLSDADKRGIADAAKTMADAGRVHIDDINRAAKAISEAAPTAKRTQQSIIDFMRAMNGK